MSEAGQQFLIDRNHVGQHLLGRDPTGSLFAALSFMDSVEDWVLQQLEKSNEASSEDVKIRLHRLSEIIYQYRMSIPADNYTFLQVLSWLNTSVVIYVIDYLAQHQQDFMQQLVDYAQANCEIDVNAALMVKRFRALYRARLLDRIFSPDGVDYVMRVLLRNFQ